MNELADAVLAAFGESRSTLGDPAPGRPARRSAACGRGQGALSTLGGARRGRPGRHGANRVVGARREAARRREPGRRRRARRSRARAPEQSTDSEPSVESLGRRTAPSRREGSELVGHLEPRVWRVVIEWISVPRSPPGNGRPRARMRRPHGTAVPSRLGSFVATNGASPSSRSGPRAIGVRPERAARASARGPISRDRLRDEKEAIAVLVHEVERERFVLVTACDPSDWRSRGPSATRPARARDGRRFGEGSTSSASGSTCGSASATWIAASTRDRAPASRDEDQQDERSRDQGSGRFAIGARAKPTPSPIRAANAGVTAAR